MFDARDAKMQGQKPQGEDTSHVVLVLRKNKAGDP